MSIWSRLGRAVLAPAGPRARLVLGAVATLAVLAFAIWYTRSIGDPIFPVDDAYISLHNGEVLFVGKDARFVGTPALVGSTSAIHVALSGLFQVVLPGEWAHWVVMLLGMLAFVLALVRLAFVLQASVLEALLMLAASLLVANMPHQLLNGLETSFALAGLTWALAAARDPQARAWELPIACGLMPFLRPELIAVSGLLLLFRLSTDWRTAGTDRALRTLGYFVAAAGPWMLLYWITSGTPYPNTIEAKKYFFAEGCAPPEARFTAMVNGFTNFRDTIGYFSYAAVLLVMTIPGWVGLVFGVVFWWAYYERFPGALGHYEQRYMYVLLPFVIYAVASLIPLRKTAARLVAAALFVVCAWQGARELKPRWDYHMATLGFTRSELDGVATWLDEHAQGQKVLLHDAGYVGAYVDARLSDLVGLKTPASIPIHRDLTWASCGRDRHQAIDRIARHEQPDYLVVLGGWDGIFGISQSLRDRGWRLEPRYQRAYIVYEITGRP